MSDVLTRAIAVALALHVVTIAWAATLAPIAV